MRKLTAATSAIAVLAAVLTATGCRTEDDAGTGSGPEGEGEPDVSITIEAQTPEPLSEDFDPEQCALMGELLADMARLNQIAGTDELMAILFSASQGDMSGVNAAGIEINTVGADFRDHLDETAPLIADPAVASALDGWADYYERYHAIVAQMMATATSWEQLSEDATAVTQASQGLHAQALIDAILIEEYVEDTCQQAVDVFTDEGIAGEDPFAGEPADE